MIVLASKIYSCIISISPWGGVAQLVEQLLCKQPVAGSIPVTSIFAALAQLVRAQPCHGWGRGFEPRRSRDAGMVELVDTQH